MMQLEVNNSHMFHMISVFSYYFLMHHAFAFPFLVLYDLHVFLLLFLQALVDSIENSSPKVSCFTAVLCEICLEYT